MDVQHVVYEAASIGSAGIKSTLRKPRCADRLLTTFTKQWPVDERLFAVLEREKPIRIRLSASVVGHLKGRPQARENFSCIHIKE